MKIEELTRRDIENKLPQMGDYVKINYLTGCLKNKIDFDARRFVLVKLSELYSNKKMFSEGGRTLRAAADINTSTKNKVGELVKATEFFIKGGSYDDAEITLNKALSFCEEKQKKEIMNNVKDIYKSQGDEYMKKDKRKNAAVVYEKILLLDLNENERTDTQKKLLSLYESLGEIREYFKLKKILEKK